MGGDVEIWDLDSGDPLATLPLPAADPTRVLDLSNSNRIVVRNDDELRLWDLNDHAVLAELDAYSDKDPVAADAGTLRILSRGGLVTMPLDPDQRAANLCRIVGRDLTDAERRTLPPGTPTEPVCPPI